MRRIALVLASLLLSASAHAELITFEYTGTINTLRETYTATGLSRSVVSSSVVPGSVRVGDDFHGAITIDTNLPLYSGTPNSAWYYDPSPAPPQTMPSTMIFDKTGSSISSAAAAPTISVSHGPGTYDYLSIAGARNANNVGLDFSFYDSSSANLSGLSIPSNINWSAWSNANAMLYWMDGAHGRSLTMEGMLTSVTKVSAVPEPASYAMMLAGLALVSGVAARRKKQRG
ncbi:PEP-CTERM sorting domain-containing protein [Duganella vulcania]|nr:PEP-CTERM sorting domain-containing protein [Duganella vulcania]